MSSKKFLLLLVFTMVMCMTSCGNEDKIGFTEKRNIEKINKALEMSYQLKSGEIETNILEGSFYPKKDVRKINASFNKDNENKDKEEKNIEFSILFTYDDKQEQVTNLTNYEGIFLNAYYPYDKYNKIENKAVKSVTVNELASGKEYIVLYKGSHFSRRMEWEYCKVEDDYETFLINEDGIIVEYKSETTYKREDSDNSQWVESKSQLSVNLNDYKLLD